MTEEQKYREERARLGRAHAEHLNTSIQDFWSEESILQRRYFKLMSDRTMRGVSCPSFEEWKQQPTEFIHGNQSEAEKTL